MKYAILALILTTVTTADLFGRGTEMGISHARPLAKRDFLQLEKRGGCLGKCSKDSEFQSATPPASPRQRQRNSRPSSSSFDLSRTSVRMGRVVQIARPPLVGSSRPLPDSGSESSRSGH